MTRSLNRRTWIHTYELNTQEAFHHYFTSKLLVKFQSSTLIYYTTLEYDSQLTLADEELRYKAEIWLTARQKCSD